MTFLYSSYHNYLDFSSGAALSMREVLLELARSGARVRALCGAFFDTIDVGEREYLATLNALGIEGVVQEKRVMLNGSSTPVRLVVFNDSGVEGTIFFVDDSGHRLDAEMEYYFDRYGVYINGERCISLSDAAKLPQNFLSRVADVRRNAFLSASSEQSGLRSGGGGTELTEVA